MPRLFLSRTDVEAGSRYSFCVFPSLSVLQWGPSGHLSCPAQPRGQLDTQVGSRGQVPSGTATQEDVPCPCPGPEPRRTHLAPREAPVSRAAWICQLQVPVRPHPREQVGTAVTRRWPSSTAGRPGPAPPQRKSFNKRGCLYPRHTEVVCEPVSGPHVGLTLHPL